MPKVRGRAFWSGGDRADPSFGGTGRAWTVTLPAGPGQGAATSVAGGNASFSRRVPDGSLLAQTGNHHVSDGDRVCRQPSPSSLTGSVVGSRWTTRRCRQKPLRLPLAGACSRPTPPRHSAPALPEPSRNASREARPLTTVPFRVRKGPPRPTLSRVPRFLVPSLKKLEFVDGIFHLLPGQPRGLPPRVDVERRVRSRSPSRGTTFSRSCAASFPQWTRWAPARAPSRPWGRAVGQTRRPPSRGPPGSSSLLRRRPRRRAAP